ncbi:DEAD-box ATP-dependent RNA helicase 16-like protein [Trifolium pratense]|uniref:DEAD-box ATP-dependent RNA helicase 16-like protein n=1 Tax=Trifolium pratense TaxID=57577 RepID=A0A2K3LRB3_TRIPR|nr:DEAD-box ATP-dependent RNA helicase 16-like protein [Trifolium pratense]
MAANSVVQCSAGDVRQCWHWLKVLEVGRQWKVYGSMCCHREGKDVAKSVTKIAVRESRAQDLRNEILNSEKLKAHFETNPKDLDLLKHDKVLSKNAPPPHLRDVPDYLIDKTTKEARDMVKLTRDAMGNNNRRRGSKRKSRKGGGDPLMAISTGVSKRPHKGFKKDGGSNGFKRDGGSNGRSCDRQKHKKTKAF